MEEVEAVTRMSDIDLPVSPQASATGYRLQKLEVFNWGTFDGEVHSVRPNGQTTLLVGQNGSGKSTLVDALLTLLVRPGIRNFNVAAGAKKTERDERSYMKGAYDRSGDQESGAIEVKFLRSKNDGYSVILATFQNAASGKTFTIAQLLYLSSDQSVEKIYCFSDGERSIRDDFNGLGSADGLVRTLRQRDWKATKTFIEGERWFTQAVHARPKAMEVFNQTVAVKDIQRLNDFIRQHMLEPHPWGERVDRLLAHFVQLREAHQNLLRVRQQHDYLEPIGQLGATYTARAKELTDAERLIHAFEPFFARRTIDLFAPELERVRRHRDQTRSLKDELAGAIEQQLDDARRLRNEIEHAGGARLRELPLLIAAQQAHADRKRRDHERLHSALRRAGIVEVVGDEAAFTALSNSLMKLSGALTRSEQESEAQREAAVLARGEVRRDLAEYRDELHGLQQRRENLPEWSAAVRRSICAQLGVPIQDLPFAAELIAVRQEERHWQPSIEGVLRNFALSLLVPQRLYFLVSSHVDKTRLTDDRGRGRRLVYLRVGDQTVDAASSSSPASFSLIRKLNFREGHSLLPWVKAELQRHFDYRCCETIEEFQQARGLALTQTRHAKSGDRRHDKDDREQATDPRNYVLGWDNREKQQRLAADIARLSAEEMRFQGDLERLDGDLAVVRTRLAAIGEARVITAFSEIDHAGHELQVQALEQERRAMEEGSEVISLLKQRLSEIEVRQVGLRAARDEAVANEREFDNQIAGATTLIANAHSELDKCAADGSLSGHEQCFEHLDAFFVDTPLAVQTFFQQQKDCRSETSAKLERVRAAISPLKDELLAAMSRFMRAFPEENDLRDHIDYLNGFLGLRQRILDEDLPKHERRFKERLNEKVIQEIGLFRGELERERRSIQDKIETLNASLRQLEYRPGTHIQLEPRPIRDAEIMEFQLRLRECIEGSFDDSAEGNEARFVRIQQLLHRLQDENNRRWRDKVTDVRRWFDFVAAVVDRQTLQTISIYQDSSGQSGGEKAKLAFTILVAAIAYQYDLDPGQTTTDRLHFVVVDEMFSKVDDQHAEYALELFRQFGLQLLIVAPLDAKARVTQPYVGCYLHVTKRQNRSEIFAMTAQEFESTVGDARARNVQGAVDAFESAPRS